MATPHNYADLSGKHIDEHIDNLVKLAREIKVGNVTIMTGGNALGKSLIRKLTLSLVKEQLDEDGVGYNEQGLVRSTSMQLRTEYRPEMSALSNVFSDMPHESTSNHSFYMLDALLKGQESELKEKTPTKSFLVIDEFEIGMSKEVILGTCEYLNETLEKIGDTLFGVLIITHSEIVVRNVKHDKFINIEGMTEDEWCEREIVPVKPSDLNKWSDALFGALQKRLR